MVDDEKIYHLSGRFETGRGTDAGLRFVPDSVRLAVGSPPARVALGGHSPSSATIRGACQN